MSSKGYCELMWRRWSLPKTLILPRSPVVRQIWLARRNDELYRCELDLERFMQDAQDMLIPDTDLWNFCNRIVMMRRTELNAQRDFLDSVKVASQWSRVYSLQQIIEAEDKAYQRGKKEIIDWVIYFAINGVAIAIAVAVLRWIMGA